MRRISWVRREKEEIWEDMRWGTNEEMKKWKDCGSSNEAQDSLKIRFETEVGSGRLKIYLRGIFKQSHSCSRLIFLKACPSFTFYFFLSTTNTFFLFSSHLFFVFFDYLVTHIILSFILISIFVLISLVRWVSQSNGSRSALFYSALHWRY